MNKYITSMNDLRTIFNSAIKKAMILTEEEIYEIMFKKVNEYYSEKVFKNGTNQPVSYKRTFKLIDNLKSSVTETKSGFECRVGWTDEYISFRYRGKNSNTGKDVLNSFNSAYHGATNKYKVSGEHNYWDEIIDEIESKGGMRKIFLKHLTTLL